MQEQQIKPKRVLSYFWKKYMTEKKYFFSLLFFRTAQTFIALLPAIYFKEIINLLSDFVGSDKSQIFSIAIGLLISIVWIKVVSVITYRATDFSLINMSINIMRKIYLECFEYLHRHSFRFFTDNFTGSLIKKVNKFVGSYDLITDTLTFEIAPIILNLIFILIIIGLKDRKLSLILFVWFIVFIIVQYFLYRRNYPYEIKTNVQDSVVSGVLSDTITNNFNIKIFSSLDREYSDFSNEV